MFSYVSERSQIGTVQAVGYIGARSHTEGHEQHPISSVNRTANDTYCKCILNALYIAVQALSIKNSSV